MHYPCRLHVGCRRLGTCCKPPLPLKLLPWCVLPSIAPFCLLGYMHPYVVWCAAMCCAVRACVIQAACQQSLFAESCGVTPLHSTCFIAIKTAAVSGCYDGWQNAGQGPMIPQAGCALPWSRLYVPHIKGPECVLMRGSPVIDNRCAGGTWER